MTMHSKITQALRDASYAIRSLAPVKTAVSFDIPFVCQFSRPEHAEPTLKKTLSPLDDPHWRESGATSPERYAEWAFTMCGMACTAMALAHYKKKVVAPAELAEDALLAGVYRDEHGELSSMRYKEFTDWIRRHGLTARMHSRLSIRSIRHALAKGHLVILSVNPNIRGYETAAADQKGGHLVLVTGYDQEKGTISINNPSGFASTGTQKGHTLPTKTFASHYAGRGIVLLTPPAQGV